VGGKKERKPRWPGPVAKNCSHRSRNRWGKPRGAHKNRNMTVRKKPLASKPLRKRK